MKFTVSAKRDLKSVPIFQYNFKYFFCIVCIVSIVISLEDLFTIYPSFR